MALETLFNDIAAAIHEKDGKADGIPASDFPARIRAIPTDLGGVRLEAIEIAAPPLKTHYSTGDVFQPAGMEVYASFSNGLSMPVDHANLTFDPSGPLEEGTAAVTVNFQWGLKLVSASQPISVSQLPETLEDCTWEQIARWSSSGALQSYYPSWSQKTITLNGPVGNTVFDNLEISTAILGFDHNQEVESPGEHRTHFLAFVSGKKIFGLADNKYYEEVSDEGWFSFNVGNITTGGYTKSQLYRNIIPAIKQAFPQDLRSVLNPVHKYTWNGTEEEEFVDSVIVPSGVEMFDGHKSDPNFAHQSYYSAMGSSSARKYVYDYRSGQVVFARLRDIYNSSNTEIVWTNGSLDYGRAGLSAGLVLIFTI